MAAKGTLEFGVMTLNDIHLLLEGLDRSNEIVTKTANHVIYNAINKILRPALEEKLRNTGVAVDKQREKYDTPLIEGIKTYMSTNGDKSKTGWISILGERGYDDGTWQLRFYEGGTQERHNRRTGQSYGSIKPTYFFSQTINEQTDTVLSAIKEAIERLKIDISEGK